MALESLDDFYPNQTAREFLAIYSVRASKGDMLSFHKKEKGQPWPYLSLDTLTPRVVN